MSLLKAPRRLALVALALATAVEVRLVPVE